MHRPALAAAFLCFALTVASLPAEPGASLKPNIILVMADDQGWGDTGYNGHPFVKTPELDAMAKNAFVFDRFYAGAPVCSPTRASVMTGRSPIRAKVPNHGRYMRPQEQTIAETLKDAGYVTGIFGKVHLGSGQPDTPCNPGGMGFDEWVVGLNFFDNDPYLSRNGKVEHREGKGSVILMDDALAFLKKHKDENKPMFTVIWFPSPHDPHQEVPDGPELYTGEKNAASSAATMTNPIAQDLTPLFIEKIVWEKMYEPVKPAPIAPAATLATPTVFSSRSKSRAPSEEEAIAATSRQLEGFF